jgi:predicted dinucleotide-binding enzyme
MADGPLHVVFGAGNVGRALAAHLSGLGLPVRVVSRSQPAALPEGVEWRGADAGDVPKRRLRQPAAPRSSTSA